MQAQIINLFKSLKEKMNLTCLFISHDLAMLRYISDRIAVIYNGKIVEIAETEELYSNPIISYTKELITSILTIDINNKFKVDINERSKFIIDNDNSRWIEVKKNHFVYLSNVIMNRSIQAEGSFAQIKQDMSFRRFICRGQKNVLAESILLAMANINKLHKKHNIIELVIICLN